jgi:hypothetical protein
MLFGETVVVYCENRTENTNFQIIYNNVTNRLASRQMSSEALVATEGNHENPQNSLCSGYYNLARLEW